MYKIDFTEPHWLIYTYHTIGGVSLCINLFGIYLLTFELKELGAFRYYLMLFQVVCSLADITITTLSSIVPLYPLFAISSYGILALWLDVSAHYCLINVGVWAYLEMESLLLCFFKKHQTIAVIIDVHVIPKFIPYFCYLMAIVFPAIPCVGLDFLTVQEEKQLEYINMTSPEYYTKFASLPNFSMYKESNYLYGVIIITFIEVSVLIALLVFFNMDLVRMMVRLKSQISAVNYQRHREAIQSLVIQTFVSVICSAPTSCFALALALRLEHSQLIAELMLVVFSCHSSTNIISLLIFSPPYRRFLEKSFKRNRRQISVHVHSQSG